ncbi:MAG: glycosyltransferase family 39 protein [Hyphomicrobiales bacterium]|nr:MAG: glycosyltransferase family 39 protein [Hyphomicrobiales bacterium]
MTSTSRPNQTIRREFSRTTGAIAVTAPGPDVLLQSMQNRALNAMQDFTGALGTLVPALREERPAETASRNPLLLPALLLAYVTAMMVFSLCVRCWAPLHTDMTEMAAWGQQFQLGYSKHPPLAAWGAGAWFLVMPHTNWSFELFAVLVSALGLAGIWATAGLYLDSRGQRLAMLPMILTPALTTWAFKYNANSILLALWPWTTYFFLAMLERSRLRDAVLAGCLAGLAMLGKYYSLVLFATLFVVLLMHPRRNAVLSSAAPYIAVLVGLVVIAPHVWWVYETGASTIAYAIEKTHFDIADSRATTLRSVAGSLLTLLGPALFMALAFRDDRAGLTGRLGQGLRDPARRWFIVLAWGPLLFTVLAHLATNIRIGGDFLIPAFLMVPLAFLVQLGPPMPARPAVRLTGGVLAVLLIGAVLSPAIGVAAFLTQRPPGLEPRAELAAAVTDIWRGATKTPLKQVTGVERIATAITFYSDDHPDYLDGAKTFQFTRDDPRIVRDGLVFVCASEDAECLGHAHRTLGEDGVQRYTYTGSHRVFGYAGPMSSFQIFLVAPRAETAK